MTHELSNRISNIIDKLEGTYIELNNISKYNSGDLEETGEQCVEDALSCLNGTIEALYAVIND